VYDQEHPADPNAVTRVEVSLAYNRWDWQLDRLAPEDDNIYYRYLWGATFKIAGNWPAGYNEHLVKIRAYDDEAEPNVSPEWPDVHYSGCEGTLGLVVRMRGRGDTWRDVWPLVRVRHAGE